MQTDDRITEAGTEVDISTTVQDTSVSQHRSKPHVVRSALVTPDNYRGMEEWYMAVVECPKCKHKVPANSNFCSGCGIGLKLSTTVKRYVDTAW